MRYHKMCSSDMWCRKSSEITKKSPIPVVDIHFDYKLALKAIENGVSALRINLET